MSKKRARPPARPDELPPVVGIGGSAGGLEACSELVSRLPPESGLALVVVHHLEPRHTSMLPDILARATPLEVVSITDGMTPASNRIHVMPPGVRVSLKEGRLVLEPQPPGLPRPIDCFLTSLAHELQHQAIGVVLSGTGSDGTQGLQAIKLAGGLTFVQDDQTARYSGMPSSARASGAVDFCLPPGAIAEELLRLAGHPLLRQGPGEKAAPASEPILRLLAYLKKVTGVDFAQYKPNTLARRIQRRLMLLGLESLETYLTLLRQNPTEVEALYQDLLISVTGLFRDPEVYDHLKAVILPELLASRDASQPMRIWVPGCSRGDEVYSIVICLQEVLGEAAASYPIQVFATDVNDRAIEQARAGCFPESIVDQVSPHRLGRYFVRQPNGGYQIKKVIRDLCVFARQDLTSDPPFSRLDLISCRNVLIYLSPAQQQRILRMFHYALQPHGRLLMGPSESLGRAADLFEELDKGHRFYAPRAVHLSLDPDLALSQRTSLSTLQELPELLPRPVPNWGHLDIHREADRVVMARFAPAGVVIDEALEVLQFRGKTGLFLEPPPGAVTHNLLNLAREGLLSDLRTAIHESLTSDRPVRRSGVRVKSNHHHTELDLEVIPLHTPGRRERCLLVLFQPTAEIVASEAPSSQTQTEQQELLRLRQELSATRDYLASLTQQHEIAHEDLKAANEEVQSANEELQSANEELQTAQEELQSTNEELTTLNEELYDRNLELTRANNDLHNLIGSVNIPVMILGPDLTIRRITPSAQKLLNLIPGDVGRRLADLRAGLLMPGLEERVSEVLDTLYPQELEQQDASGRWYSVRIRPYRTTDHQIDGVTIAVLDIDPLKRGLEESRAARDLARAVLEAVDQPLLVLDADFKVLQANRSFCRIFQLPSPALQQQSFFEIDGGRWALPQVGQLLEGCLRGATQQLGLEMEVAGRGACKLGLQASAVTSDGGRASILLSIDVTPA